MLEEPILTVVAVHSQEESESPDIDFPPLGLHAGDVVVGDNCLVHQSIQVWFYLDDFPVLVGDHRYL